MKVYIYSLVDPRNQEVRYVGKTNNPADRFFSHVNHPDNKNNKDWVLELSELGLSPSMQILEVTDEEGWQEAEKYWILHGKENGWKLNNISNGGAGGNGAAWHRDSVDLETFESCLTKEKRNDFRKYSRSERIKIAKKAGLLLVEYIEGKNVISIPEAREKMRLLAMDSV